MGGKLVSNGEACAGRDGTGLVPERDLGVCTSVVSGTGAGRGEELRNCAAEKEGRRRRSATEGEGIGAGVLFKVDIVRGRCVLLPLIVGRVDIPFEVDLESDVWL